MVTQLAHALSRTAHEVSQSNDSSFRPLPLTLTFSIDFNKHTLYSVVGYIPWKSLLTTLQTLTRHRRGLFNHGGKVLDNIFGLATEDDVS